MPFLTYLGHLGNVVGTCAVHIIHGSVNVVTAVGSALIGK